MRHGVEPADGRPRHFTIIISSSEYPLDLALAGGGGGFGGGVGGGGEVSPLDPTLLLEGGTPHCVNTLQ